MGRIMSFDQDGRRVRDFDKSDYDFLCRYGRTPEEVLDENAKLRELVLTLAHCAAGHGCDLCPLNGKEGIVNALDMCDGIHDHMRQLGVVK